MKKYVAYIKVSTTKQELGLESQLNIINNYIGKNDTILKLFTEKVEEITIELNLVKQLHIRRITTLFC
jgi:DNA invertase Pin-like site-specific DNA recombinase